MSSWLGKNFNDGINSLKGQIVSLTKDVLAEDEGGQAEAAADSSLIIDSGDYIKEINALQYTKAELESRLTATELESRRKIAALEKQLLTYENDIHILKEKTKDWNWDELHNKKDVSNKEKESVTKSLLSTTEQDGVVENLQSQLNELSKEFEEAKTANKQLKSNIQELDFQHQEALEILFEKKTKLETDLVNTKKQLSELNARIIDLQSELQHKSPSTDNDISKELSNLMSQNEKVATEIENLSSKSTTSVNSSEIEELQQHLERANINIEQLTHEKVVAQMEADKLKNSVESLQTLKLELNDSIIEKTKLHEFSMKKEEEGKKGLAHLNDRIEQIQLNNMKYEAVMEEQSSENEILRNKYHEEVKRNQLLNGELSEMVSNKDDTQKQSAIVCLEELLRNCNLINYDELPSAISEKDSEIARLRCERDKLQEESESTLQELKYSQDVVEAMESDKLDLEAECEELRDQLEELQYGKREEPEGSLSRTLTTIEEEDTDPVDDQAKCQIESNKCERSEDSVVKRERIGQLKTEILTLNGKCQKLEKEITSLKCENDQLKYVETMPNNGDQLISTIVQDGDGVTCKPPTSNCDSDIEFMSSDKHLTAINFLRSQVIFKDDQIDDLRNTIHEIGQLFGLKEYNLRETFCSAKRQVGHLESQIQVQKQTCETLTNDVKEKETQLESINELFNDAVRQKDLIEKYFNDTKEEKEQLQREVSSMNDSVVNFTPKKVVWENKIAELEQLLQQEKNKNVEHVTQDLLTIEPLKRENVQLTEANQGFITECKSLEIDNDLLNRKIVELSAEKRELIENYEDSLSTRNAECFQKNKSISDLRDDITSLQSSLTKVNSSNNQDNAAYKATIRNLEEESSNLKVENDSLNNELMAGRHAQELEMQRHVKELSMKKEEELKVILNEQNDLRERNVQLVSDLKLQKEDDFVSSDEKNKLKQQLIEMQKAYSQQQVVNDECNNIILHLNKSLETKTLEFVGVQENMSTNVTNSRKLEEAMMGLKKQNEQLLMANSSFNSQYEVISKELLAGHDKERHLHTECDRLKEHLVAIEESYTNEAVQAEQREVALKQTIAKLHDKMASHSNLYSSTNQKNADKVETLQESLKSAILGRDESLQNLHVSEESLLENQEALRRLNQVLLDFQKSYNKDVREATERDRRQMEKECAKNFDIQREVVCLKRKIDDLEESNLSSQQLHNDILNKNATIVSLQSQVSAMQQVVKKSQDEVQSLQTSTEVKVDKHLVRNLFVGYFASAPDKQREVLHIIAQILDFSSNERVRTGLDINPNSWLTSVANFLAPPASSMRVTSKVDVLDHSSLSQAFIRFLEDESAVRPHAKLPAIEMAEEASQKALKNAQRKSNECLTGTAPSTEQFSALIDTPVSTLENVVLQPVDNQHTTAIESKISEQKYLKNLLNDDKHLSNKS